MTKLRLKILVVIYYEKGFIQNEKGTFHKNHVANLMNVCESCHDEIHNKNLSLVRKKTTKGYTLTT